MSAQLNKTDLIFALDIGTRQCVGIIAERHQDVLRVVDVEIREHASRTMLDGQIHNVNEVAKVVNLIKQALENRGGFALSRVGVAVAGRALRTVKAKVRREISLYEEISEASQRNLELEAVSSVLRDANSEFGQGDFFCVGYSVLEYCLDNGPIADLVGHFGKNVSCEVIATFLPRVVLDSMLSVLRKAGLEATNLTLEPIAAINVIIPPDVRRLNLALLDIGAGTSDIALTRDGAVIGYGMVPEAGDEVTEALCEKYILDFTTAERIKRLLSVEPSVQFKDILGRDHTVSAAEIRESLQQRVRELAQSISRQVLTLNQNLPNAVVLVGGGSLTPLLEKELADALPLPAANVGVRLPEMISGVEDTTGLLKGPEMVTPLGILIMTAQTKGLRFVEMFVNDRRLQVLDMQQSLDVVSALVAAGIDSRKLYGRIGQALCVEVNSDLKVIKGKMGTPASITINDKPAQLTDAVKHGDRIGFEPAIDGADARALVGDVIAQQAINVTINNHEIAVSPEIVMNGDIVRADAELPDRANITYKPQVTCRAVLQTVGAHIEPLEEREIIVRINKEPRVLTQTNFQLLVNGARACLDTEVTENNVIEFNAAEPAYYRVRDIVDLPPATPGIKVEVNGAEYSLAGNPGRVYMNSQLVGPDEFVIDRAEIATKPPEDMPTTVAHLLPSLSLDVEAQKGKHIQITVDGESAGFTTPLSNGARIRIDFAPRSGANGP